MSNSSPNGWNQFPPTSVPWGLYSQPRVTKFSGEMTDADESSSNFPCSAWTISDMCNGDWNLQNKSQKRKMDMLSESNPRKQLITEERISADLSQLTIGPTSTPLESTSLEYVSNEKMDDSAILPGSRIKLNAGSKLVLSEELRRLRQETSIPTSLLEQHLNKPCMAVVLWQPPFSIVSEGSRSRANPESNLQREISARNEPENVVENIQDDTNNNEPINDYNINPEVEMEEAM